MKLNLNYKAIALGVMASGLMFADDALKLSGIGAVAEQVRTQFAQMSTMLTAAAYLIGLGFLVSGIFKLKAHKDNAQQNPLSVAVMHLTTGALLIYLPSLVTAAGGTFFASTSTVGVTGATDLGTTQF